MRVNKIYPEAAPHSFFSLHPFRRKLQHKSRIDWANSAIPDGHSRLRHIECIALEPSLSAAATVQIKTKKLSSVSYYSWI